MPVVSARSESFVRVSCVFQLAVWFTASGNDFFKLDQIGLMKGFKAVVAAAADMPAASLIELVCCGCPSVRVT